MQQVLEVSNPKFSSKEIVCTISVPEAKEFGQALLFNGLTNKGYWYQIGISNGTSLDTLKSDKFSISYMASDPKGKVLFLTTQMKGKLEPNQVYNVALRVEGDEIVAGVFDISGNPIKIVSGPSFGSTKFIGGKYLLENGSSYFTGVMTEIISAKPDVKAGTVKYTLFSPMPMNQNEYILSSNIGGSVLGGDKAYSEIDYPQKKTRIIESNKITHVMGNYIEYLIPIEVEENGKKSKAYTFTTSSK